jgi:DEAD/DEAH box helicase domain-containing protein
VFQRLSRDECENVLLALAHLLKNISPVYVMTDMRDIGSSETLKQQTIGLPTVFLYDRYPGGVGLADRLFEVKEELLQASLWRVRECSCQNGCPSCVGPDRLNKKTTEEVLKRILSRMLEEQEASKPMSREGS